MLLAEDRVSERGACATVLLARTVYRFVGHRRDDRAVRQRLKELAETRVRYGFSAASDPATAGRLARQTQAHIPDLQGRRLNLRTKRPRRNKTAAHRQQRPLLTGPHQCWQQFARGS